MIGIVFISGNVVCTYIYAKVEGVDEGFCGIVPATESVGAEFRKGKRTDPRHLCPLGAILAIAGRAVGCRGCYWGERGYESSRDDSGCFGDIARWLVDFDSLLRNDLIVVPAMLCGLMTNVEDSVLLKEIATQS